MSVQSARLGPILGNCPGLNDSLQYQAFFHYDYLRFFIACLKRLTENRFSGCLALCLHQLANSSDHVRNYLENLS